jgi:hypothetical protein
MKQKITAFAAAFVTFIVVGLLAVQAMYYIKGYPPTTSMLEHQFLVAIGFLIGIIAASYVYTYLKGENESLKLDNGEDEVQK